MNMANTEKQNGNSPKGLSRTRGLKPFVKGQSGNPKGRPPKHECLTSLLKEELEKISSTDKEGRTWKELIVLATLKLAMQGNATALREVWDRVDGKVRQDIGINADVSAEINERLHAARLRLARWEETRVITPAVTAEVKGGAD